MSTLTRFPSFIQFLIHALELLDTRRRRPVGASADRTARQSEGVWHRTVELTDDLIDSFLPAGVAVSPSPDG